MSYCEFTDSPGELSHPRSGRFHLPAVGLALETWSSGASCWKDAKSCSWTWLDLASSSLHYFQFVILCLNPKKVQQCCFSLPLGQLRTFILDFHFSRFDQDKQLNNSYFFILAMPQPIYYIPAEK